MWMKVRRGGISALVILTGASLLQTSTSFAGSHDGRTLNLRVPGGGFRGAHGSVGAWVVGGVKGQMLRAAHAVAGENPAEGGPSKAGQLVMVKLKLGRRRREFVLTNAASVSQMLDALGVTVHPMDVVKPSGDSPISPRVGIRVVRIQQMEETQIVDVPFQTLIRYSKALAPGQVNVVTPGTVGKAQATYLVTYRNGKERARELVSQVVVVAPVDRVEDKGPAPATPAGVEFGDASWYSWSGCGSGYHAAHKTLPFGTVVTVTDLDNGRSVTVTINDRGPYIAGRIIDLCPTAFSALAPLGQGVARVEITW